MRTYSLIIFLIFAFDSYSQMQVKYVLDPEMSYLITIENVSKEDMNTYQVPVLLSKQTKREGESLKVCLGCFNKVDSLTFTELKNREGPTFLINEKKEYDGNLRLSVQDWDWNNDSVKHVIFECRIPYVLLSSGREGIYSQVDTVELGEIKPEFARVHPKWKVAARLEGRDLYSEITNLMSFPVQLRLTIDPEIVVRSTAYIYNFDGSKWTFATTTGLSEYGGKMKTTFAPGETRKFYSLIDYPKELKGIFFVRYSLLSFVPSTFTYSKTDEEVVLLMNPLFHKDGHRFENIYWNVDTAPQFPGGEKALSAFFENRIKNLKKQAGLHAIVKVIIEKDGSISFPCVIERNILDFDESVLPIIRQMPKWKPAYIKGKPVRVFHDIKIDF